MASKLSATQVKAKNQLISEGCKVVERSWGHLVIMPSIKVAMDYFRAALFSSIGIEYNGGYSSLGGTIEDQLDSVGVHKSFLSPEYLAKYKKQFEYLNSKSGREKVMWIIEDAITQGDPRKIHQVNQLTDKLVGLIYEINPSLKLDVHRQRAENGDIWDAGLIGSEDPMPCWDMKVTQKIKRGAGGDGAYRIIINTDTSFGRSDSENCLVLCAMVSVLQQYSDVEIWVQQGWVANHQDGHKEGVNTDYGSPMNGITLFPAFRGSGLHPAQIMFWAGHPMRDSIFSHLINEKIGRESSGCSEAAELDCDLYTRNGCFSEMPPFNFNLHNPEQEFKQLKALAKWTAGQLSSVLLEEEDLAGISND